MENNQTQKRFIIGFGIFVAGLALLLSNIGVLDYQIKRYLLRWEVILIVFGLVNLFAHENKGFGIVLLVIGGTIYLRDFFELNFNFWQLFWPVILILVGVMIILKRRMEPTPHCERLKGESTDDIIDEVAVFGGGDRTVHTQNFRGGKILAIFGGSNFHMTRAKLAPGTNYIDVLAIFGGMKFVVPDDWNIRVNVVSIFGGFSDKHRVHFQDKESEEPECELVIKGFVVFGGGEIKSY